MYFIIYGYSQLELHPGSNAVNQTRTLSRVSLLQLKLIFLGHHHFFYKLTLISVSLLLQKADF